VQAYSGSTANFAVYTALLQPHDRVMGLDLPSGGHLTHGYYTAKKKISATSIFFESFPYKVSPTTGLVDYDGLEATAFTYRPKMIICGASAYPREWDYKRMRKIADDVGAYLFCDMAHYSGLVAAQVLNSPFEHCHVVTTTTHKSLRGPRGAIIFFRREFEEKINFAVFPSIQGGPHNNAISAIAVQLKEVNTPQFQQYAQQIVANSRALAAALTKRGYKLATGGSDNHLVLWDLRPQKLTGNKYELICDAASITVNKNAIHGDTSALTPGGVRVGTPALTSRGFKEKDFEAVAEFLHRAVEISLQIQSDLLAKLTTLKPDTTGPASCASAEGASTQTLKQPIVKLEAFKEALLTSPQVKQLKEDVEKFSKTFFMPGFDVTKLKYEQ